MFASNRKSTITFRLHATVFAALFGILFTAQAKAYLGGFEPADGYTISPIPQSSTTNPTSQYIDVTYYNAGQNGANAGGGSLAPLAPDTGLWKLLTQPGEFFRTAAKRSSYTSGAPPYAPFPSFSGDDVPVYMIGNHNPGYLAPAHSPSAMKRHCREGPWVDRSSTITSLTPLISAASRPLP